MSNFIKASDDPWIDAQSGSLSWNTSVQFDPALLPRLSRDYEDLQNRFALLGEEIGADPKLAELAGQNCAARLHELRRREALWLYPVIACGIVEDVEARRQFLQLRLSLLAMARRVLRRFDTLAKAVHDSSDMPALLADIARDIAEYRSRNESEIFPLYDLIGRSLTSSARRA